MENVQLHWLDWVIFAFMLLISLGIGVYYALTGGRQKTTGEYLMGDRKMNLIPVTLSLMVSYISTLTLLGYPAEMYAFGSQYWMSAFGKGLGALIACFMFVPVFYPLKVVSVNEYLYLRFQSKLVRYFSCVIIIAESVFYTANVYFGPSTAIEAVSGFPAWGTILIGSFISILYTTIGGIKAVIWADAFQSVIMLMGLLAVMIVGIIAVGGLSTVFTLAKDWDRLEFFDMDPDPFKRLTFWGATIATTFHFIGRYGYFQAGVQRYSSLSSISDARKCLIGTIPGTIVLTSLSCLCGLIVFAYYTQIGCDPLKIGQISNPNQILPYFVVDRVNVPVLAGLFLASLSAASLSSASSALSASATNLWQDVLCEFFEKKHEAKKAFIIKCTVVVLGIISTLLAFAVTTIGGTIYQIIITFSSGFNGPAAALFYMGMFLPWINWKGACTGTVVGCAFGLWISFGSYISKKNWMMLPTNDENCTFPQAYMNDTATAAANGVTIDTLITTASILVNATTKRPPGVFRAKELKGINKLFSISFVWMRDLVTIITIVIAIIVSIFTGLENPRNIDPRTLHPFTRKILRIPDPYASEKKNENLPNGTFRDGERQNGSFRSKGLSIEDIRSGANTNVKEAIAMEDLKRGAGSTLGSDNLGYF